MNHKIDSTKRQDIWENTNKGTEAYMVGVVSGVASVPSIVAEAERIRHGGLIGEAKDTCRC